MRLGPVDGLIAVVLAAFVAVLAGWVSAPGLPPELWEPLAEAAGVRPPAQIAPGLWALIARGLMRLVGTVPACTVLGALGKVCLGALAGIAFLFLRELLALSVEATAHFPNRFRALDRVASVLGAAGFVCTGPVWRLGQMLGPDGLVLVLHLFAAFLLLRFLRGGGVWTARFLWPLVGVLCAESPFGVVLGGVVLVAWYWTVRLVGTNPVVPLHDPLMQGLSAWRATALFLLGFAGMVAANVWTFLSSQGLTAAGRLTYEVPWIYVKALVDALVSAASPRGWSLVLGLGVAPSLVMALLSLRNRSEERVPAYRTLLLCVFLLVIGFLPLTVWLREGWGAALASGAIRAVFLQGMGAFCSAVTCTLALGVLGADVYCRNYRRLALLRNPDLLAGEEGTHRAHLLTATRRWRRPAAVAVPLLALALTLPGVWQPRVAELLAVVDAFAEETLREMGGARWIFTDGALDALLQLKGLAEGREVHPVSMLSTDAARDVWMRAIAAPDEEDRALLRTGAWATVCAWALDKPQRAGDFVVQAGFEAWQRARRDIPCCGGVLVRAQGASDPAEKAAAHALAARILALWDGGLSACDVPPRVKEAFLFVQWRLSRIARLRALAAEKAGGAEQAAAERALAEKLDAANPSAQRVQAHNDWMRQQRGEGLTPREGLRLALSRADFNLARRYAQPILNADPDDAQANFACGMAAFVEKRYELAEAHLKRMLERAPDEAAAWNNLAAIYLRTQRFEEAARHAAKARALAPDAPEVQALLRQIEKAQAR